ncbi:hypothetical protein BDZ88DRAFT_427499 [Geranomyces variabilis]|nr:hypothetical protein BDZ88DRAFT_427499 [Geranomyces variabilis]
MSRWRDGGEVRAVLRVPCRRRVLKQKPSHFLRADFPVVVEGLFLPAFERRDRKPCGEGYLGRISVQRNLSIVDSFSAEHHCHQETMRPRWALGHHQTIPLSLSIIFFILATASLTLCRFPSVTNVKQYPRVRAGLFPLTRPSWAVTGPPLSPTT